MLAPICKREKKVTSTIFLPEASLPALGGGVDRFYTKAFLSWLDLICPLPMQATYSSLPVLSPRRGGDAPGVALMASLTDIQLLTIKTLLASDATRGAIRVAFWLSRWGRHSSPECLGTTLSLFLTTRRPTRT